MPREFLRLRGLGARKSPLAKAGICCMNFFEVIILSIWRESDRSFSFGKLVYLASAAVLFLLSQHMLNAPHLAAASRIPIFTARS